jgi:hypothetical protein
LFKTTLKRLQATFRWYKAACSNRNSKKLLGACIQRLSNECDCKEFEPMPGGEKAIYIFLTGDSSGDRFDYKLTLEGSAATDYRVTNLEPGTSSRFLMEHRKSPLKK